MAFQFSPDCLLEIKQGDGIEDCDCPRCDPSSGLTDAEYLGLVDNEGGDPPMRNDEIDLEVVGDVLYFVDTKRQSNLMEISVYDAEALADRIKRVVGRNSPGEVTKVPFDFDTVLP